MDHDIFSEDRSDLPPELIAQLSKPKAQERPVMPCPHCGKVWWKIVQHPSTHAFQVECAKCFSRGPGAVDREGAIEIWNWRKPEEERQPVSASREQEQT